MTKADEKEKKREVMKEIAKTSEAIRKKYLALKVGKMKAETNLQTNLRPIVEPLKQMVKNTETPSTADRKKLLYEDEEEEEEDEEEEGEDPTTESIITPVLTRKEKSENIRKLFKKSEHKILHSTPTTSRMMPTTDMTSPTDATAIKTPMQTLHEQQVFESSANKSAALKSSMRAIFENSHTEDRQNNYLLRNLGPLAREYLHSFFIGTSKITDNVYGVYLNNDRLMFGNSVFDVTIDDEIIVDGKKYEGTRGLYELIFKKIPNEASYSQKDIQNYKNILIVTHAHKRGNQRMGNKGYKYRRIIGPLFSPRLKKGRGITLPTSMRVTNNAIDYVHWDDVANKSYVDTCISEIDGKISSLKKTIVTAEQHQRMIDKYHKIEELVKNLERVIQNKNRQIEESMIHLDRCI